MSHCHAHGAFHGQLAPENVLLRDGHLQVVGFYVCEHRGPVTDPALPTPFSSSSSPRPHVSCGASDDGPGFPGPNETLYELRPVGEQDAPELASLKAATAAELAAADVWAVGGLIYLLLTGKHRTSLPPLGGKPLGGKPLGGGPLGGSSSSPAGLRAAMDGMQIASEGHGGREAARGGATAGGEWSAQPTTQPMTVDEQIADALLKLVRLALQPKPSQRPSISQLRGQLELAAALASTPVL